MSDGRSLTGPLRDDTDLKPDQIEILLEEYRRFLFLAASGSPASPPELLADVGRKHRRDAEAWGWLVSQLPGIEAIAQPKFRPLVYDPDYAATLERYESLFGTRPDKNVWPGLGRLRVLGWLRRLIALALVVFLIGLVGTFTYVSRIGDRGPSPEITMRFLLAVGGFLTGIAALIAHEVTGTWSLERNESSGGMGGD